MLVVKTLFMLRVKGFMVSYLNRIFVIHIRFSANTLSTRIFFVNYHVKTNFTILCVIFHTLTIFELQITLTELYFIYLYLKIRPRVSN